MKLIKEYVLETLFGAGKQYQKKEATRAALQQIIINDVKNGAVTTQKELDELVNTLDMALKALKMVPFEAYHKLAQK